jgi:general secretion pathway protein G
VVLRAKGRSEARASEPIWRRSTGRDQEHGFTIIEVIVIVVILGVIAAIIAPRLLSRIGQSKQAVAKANAASLANQVRLFIADHGRPESGATVRILWERPGNVPETGWEPYVESEAALSDPWGRAYVLKIPGEKNFDFDIVSYGSDGQPGGSGEDQDIVAP